METKLQFRCWGFQLGLGVGLGFLFRGYIGFYLRSPCESLALEDFGPGGADGSGLRDIRHLIEGPVRMTNGL